MTTEPVGLIYGRHDRLMTGLGAELRAACVYRLEELVGTKPPLVQDQPRASQLMEAGGRKS